jgi:hypothetical protein
MKYKNVYLVKANSAKGFDGELPEEIQDKILSEMKQVLDHDDIKNIICEEFDNKEYMFFKLSKMKVMRICSVLDPFVNFELTEIGDKIITGDTKDYDFVISNQQFKSFFDSYRLDVAQVDDVLDKINLKGIENIDEIDKIILSK